MASWARTFASSIGSKSIMAVTGLLLVLFVLVHLLGNLQIYLGPHAINAYGHLLQSLPELLWAMRAGLLAIFVVHVLFALHLTFSNLRARPHKYKVSKAQESGLPSRTLIWSGGLLFFFIMFHLAHFTLGRVQPELFHHVDELQRHDVFHMVVAGFSVPLISAVYVVAMLVLGFHLWHAIASLFQTLGWAHPRWRPFFEKLGKGLTLFVVLGNISIPVAVLAGIVRLPAGG